MAQAAKLVDVSLLPVRAQSAARKPTAAADSTWDEPRKLIRPRLPEHLAALNTAPRRLRGNAPLAAHAGLTTAARRSPSAAGPSEAFYFQKQIQAQTQMVFVLEDGEHLHGIIEWYDSETIKVRNSTRTLIFKRTIKYLYKAGELHD